LFAGLWESGFEPAKIGTMGSTHRQDSRCEQRKLPGGRGTGSAEYIPLSPPLIWQPGVNLNPPVYGGSVGAFATIACELRQVRKEATAAGDSGAGVSLAELPPSFQGRFEQVLSRASSLPPLLDFVGASLLATNEFRTCSEFPWMYRPARRAAEGGSLAEWPAYQ